MRGKRFWNTIHPLNLYKFIWWCGCGTDLEMVGDLLVLLNMVVYSWGEVGSRENSGFPFRLLRKSVQQTLVSPDGVLQKEESCVKQFIKISEWQYHGICWTSNNWNGLKESLKKNSPKWRCNKTKKKQDCRKTDEGHNDNWLLRRLLNLLAEATQMLWICQ